MHPNEELDSTATESQPVDPQTPAEGPNGTQAPDPNAASMDVFDAAKAAFNDDEVMDESTLANYRVDFFKTMQPDHQMAVRGLLARIEKMEKAQAEKAQAEAQRFAEERAAFEADKAALTARERAHQKAIADPDNIARLRETAAKAPTVVDPADPASVQASIEAAAAKANLDAMAPALARYEAEARRARREELFATAGLDLQKPEDVDAVKAKVRELYGDDPAGIAAATQAAQTIGALDPLGVAVKMIAAERAAAKAATDHRVETEERIAAARSLASGTERQPAQLSDRDAWAQYKRRFRSLQDAVAAASADPRMSALIARLNAAEAA